MKIFIVISLLAATLGSNAMASSKICFGSTQSEDTKGIVMLAQIDQQKVALKTTNGEAYNGTYSAYDSKVNGRDGKTYLEYAGENGGEYQEVIMVDEDLLKGSTTGLLQVRARGEGFFNNVYVCKDARE